MAVLGYNRFLFFFQEEEIKKVKDMIDKRKPDVIVVSAESRYASYYLIMILFLL